MRRTQPTGMLASDAALVFSLPRMFIVLFHPGSTYNVVFSVGVGELSAINGVAGCEYSSAVQTYSHSF